MKIYVDADACPVVRIVERLAKKHGVPCVLLCNSSEMKIIDIDIAVRQRI